MNRELAENAGDGLGSRTPQRVPSLQIKPSSQRNLLFARSQSQPQVQKPKPASSPSRSTGWKRPILKGGSNTDGLRNSKMPAPKFNGRLQRQPPSLAVAYKLAEANDAAQDPPVTTASPSLARMPCRENWKSTAADVATGTPPVSIASRLRPENRKPALTHDVAGSVVGMNESSQNSDNSDTPESPHERGKDVFSNTRLASTTIDAGRLPARKASFNSHLSSADQLGRLKPSSRAASTKSLRKENRTQDDEESITKENIRLVRSFAWPADADFTAGDLQVSDSPPVKSGRSNRRLDEIKACEREAFARYVEEPVLRPRNTRLDDIRALEQDVALAIEEEPYKMTRPVKKANTIRDKQEPLDQDSAWEMESLSRRAIASARIDRIRERDAGRRRFSASPEIMRKSMSNVRDISPVAQAGNHGLKENATASPARIERVRILAEEPEVHRQGPVDSHSRASLCLDLEHADGRRECHGLIAKGSQGDSREVLRRLSRAASGSPPVARQEEERAGKNDGAGGEKQGFPPYDLRRSVDFAGLHRSCSRASTASTRSTSATRSGLPHFDGDPTDRIEAEMKLFAATDVCSESQSLRAPSPEPDDEGPEETPKVHKMTVDSPLQPTPHVPGAFLETPATVKMAMMEPRIQPTNAKSLAETTSSGSSGYLRGRNMDASYPRKLKHSLSVKSDREPSRSLAAASHRRAKSVPHARTALINSAKPSSVKDDMMEIRRIHQIEDSTLDEVADLLAVSPDAADDQASRAIKLEQVKNEEGELGFYDRMTKSLHTGLLGIRTAKQGIERLENKMSHAGDVSRSDSHAADRERCSLCTGQKIKKPVTHVGVALPLPWLWARKPRSRPTMLGAILGLLLLWYVAESAMCHVYCKPEYCLPGQPCTWSVDDPVWGHALPTKLDRWTTGGRGQAMVGRIRPDLEDWIADMWDAATGKDIAQRDTSGLAIEQRRQHRRRLAKRGLIKPYREQPQHLAKFAAWRTVRRAKEQREWAAQTGYDVEADDSMDGDERIRGRW